MSLAKMYLGVKNLALSGLWLYVLIVELQVLLREGPIDYVALWNALAMPLAIAQGPALLEIVDSVLGLVRSPLQTTLLQVFSRIAILFGCVFLANSAREHVFFPVMIAAWSITEVVRYAFYFLKMFLGVPAPILWLRYSMFIVLYPAGIFSEWVCAYYGLSQLKDEGFGSISLPNAWNFTFQYWFVFAVMTALYIPGAPMLYFYMLGQRKKALAKSKTA